jgi:hypothetical protein
MKQLTKEDAKSTLQKLSPEELKYYKELSMTLSQPLSEANASDIKNTIQGIVKGWKGLSSAMLMAMMMNSNIAKAINTYSPETYKAINTELVTDSTKTSATVVATPGSVKSINFNESFESGKATLTNKAELVKSISELKDWMKGKDVKNFKLVITAGESQVTNQKGFEAKGSLAQARAKAVEIVIGKLGFTKVDIQTKIGTTPYEKGNDINDPKYKAEQFVTVNIVVDNDICSMPAASGGGKTGTAANDYITYNSYVSGKGEFVLSTGQVPDRLVVLDANGNVKGDSGYVTTEVSKYKDWKYTPMYVLELTKVYQANSKAVAGSKIRTITVKDSKDLRRQLLNNPNSTTYQKLGNEIAPALAEMDQMIAKGQNEFVIYDLGTKDAIVNFDQSKGEVQAAVYSPIGKTDFGVTGNCR